MYYVFFNQANGQCEIVGLGEFAQPGSIQVFGPADFDACAAAVIRIQLRGM